MLRNPTSASVRMRNARERTIPPHDAATLLALVCLCAGFSISDAAESNAVDYATQVRPMLAEKCYSCHGRLKQESDLRLDTRSLMLDAQAIVPSRSDESELLRRVTTNDSDERMPPPNEGSALKAEEIELLRQWIDQGAVAAVPLVQTKNRFVAGLLEHACQAHYSDRTSWQKMLKGAPDPVDWEHIRQQAALDMAQPMAMLRQTHGHDALQWVDTQPIDIQYPVTQYPQKVIAISLDKTPTWSGKLLGIKGQYWITDQGVFNVRKHSGYVVDLRIEAPLV